MDTNDEKYMRRCLQLARNGRLNAKPNPMVGCVIVAPDNARRSADNVLSSADNARHSADNVLSSADNTLHSADNALPSDGQAPVSDGQRIIGEGYHVRCGQGHAEVNAFASVRPEDEELLSQATVYVSLEPCSHYGKTPPCADLIISKGVRRVVVGCEDDFAKVQGRGIRKLRDAGIEVTVGVLEEACRSLNRRFFTYHRQQRPYIILKWAQTANGFIDDHGHPLAISSPFTQMLSHKLRAEEDAIVVGRVTDDREHPQLNVRHWTGADPRRIVVDRSHPLNLQSLHAHGVQSLIVEGGAKTLQSFLNDGLWDELRVETNLALTVDDGTRAPLVPATAVVSTNNLYGSNVIVTYRPQ